MKKINILVFGLLTLNIYLYSQPHIINNGSVGFSSADEYNTTAIIGQTFSGNSRSNNFNFLSGIWSTMLLPPMQPTVFASQGDYPNRTRVTWEFDPLSPSADEKIQILRNGALLSTVDANVTDFQDFNIIAGEIYNYEIIGINEYGSGSSGNDAGFSNPNGTITGTVKTQKGKAVINSEIKVSPVIGKSLKFSGVSDFVSIPLIKKDRKTGNTLGEIKLLDSLTIEFWFKPNAISNTFLLGNIDTSLFNIKLLSNGKIQFKFVNASNAPIYFQLPILENISSYTPKWFHVSITRDLNQKKIIGYVNGELILESSFNGIKGKALSELIIGKCENVIYLDEIRLWKLARNKNDIYRDYLRTGFTNDTNLVANWNFNEGIGDYIIDLTKNKFNGRLYSGGKLLGLTTQNWNSEIPSVYTSSFTDNNGEFLIDGLVYGGGTSFNITPELKVPSGRSFQNLLVSNVHPKTSFKMPYDTLFPNGQITIEVWIKPNTFSNVQSIFSSAYNGINLNTRTNGRVFTKFADNSEVESTIPLIVSKWNHVVMITDANGTRFTVNNQSAGSYSSKNNFNYIKGDSNYILIGGATNSLLNYFNGLIDEFRIWNIARLPSEIEAFKDVKLKGSEDNLSSYFQFNEGLGTVAKNLVKGHPNSILVKFNNEKFENIPSDAVSTSPYYATDIPNKTNEQIQHQFIPTQRRVNLNSSITSVDRIEFNDATVVPVSGYIVYKGTDCFVDSVEIYVDGKPTEPKTYTNNLGYYSVELDPGRDYRITPVEKVGKNDFEVKFYDVVNLTEPVSLPMFIDRTKRRLTGIVAAALSEKEVSRLINDPLSIRLDGVNDYLRVPHSNALNLTNNFSIEAWIYPERRSGTNIILSKGNNKITFAVKNSKLAYLSQTTNSWVYSADTLRDKTWQHVALTYNFFNNKRIYSFYINGNLSGVTEESSVSALTTDSRAMYIGADSTSSLSNFYFGNLAEIKLWNKTLSSTEIQSRKLERLNPKKVSNLIAYYVFHSQNGVSLTDSNNAVLFNSSFESIIEGFPLALYQVSKGGTSLITSSITNQSELKSPLDFEPTKVTAKAINGCLTVTVNVNADGTFDISNLPPNYYTVSVMHPDMEITNKILPKKINLLEQDNYVGFDFRADLNAEIRGLKASPSSKPIVVPDRDSLSGYRTIYSVPVLTTGREIEITIGVFEDYTKFFKVPNITTQTNQLDTGSVIILDQISSKPAQEFAFNKEGLTYTINPENPNISSGGTNPYQKYIQIIPKDLSGNSTKLPITKYAIVKGSVGRERTFATTSPVNLDLILHDPPGDNSYAKLEKGFSYSTITGNSKVSSQSKGTDIEASIGAALVIGKGLGVVTESTWKLAATGGFKGTWGRETTSDNTTNTNVSFSEVFTTESSNDFIGAEGDVYIGHSDNIVYGNADILDIKNYSSSNFDTLKISTTLFFFPGEQTYFAYPESFLKNNLIPKLYQNSILSKGNKDDKIQKLNSSSNSEAINFYRLQSGWDNDTTANTGSITKRNNLRNSQYYNEFYKSILQNNDSIVYFNHWASNWEKIISQNEKNKKDAKTVAFNNVDPDGNALPSSWSKDFKKNLSFAAGSPREFTMALTKSFEQTVTNTIITDNEAFVGALGGIEGDGLFVDGHALYTTSQSTNEASIVGSDTTKTTTINYQLKDDDDGDNFSVNVFRDPIYGTPVFDLVAAETSCPYEGPINGDTTNGYVTRARDNIQFDIQPIRITNIYPGEDAVFKIKLSHNGQVDQDSNRTIFLRIPQEKNPKGAQIKINGVSVEQFIEINAPIKQEVNLLLSVQRGPTEINYSNIEIEAYACEEDRSRGRVKTAVLADFNFLEPCGTVNLEMIVSPTNFGTPWVLTPTNAEKRDTVKIVAYNYNVNDPNFTQLEIQYREKITTPNGAQSSVIGKNVIDALTSKGISIDEFKWDAIKGIKKPIIIDDNYNSSVVNNSKLKEDDDGKINKQKDKNSQSGINGDPRWIRLSIGKDNLGNSQDFVTVDSLKKLSGQFVHYFSLKNPVPIIDGSYEFRAVAVCNKGLVPGMSSVYTGLIDRSGPRVIRREPNDGVLQQNDEISILYDEKIDKSDIENNLPTRILVEDLETNSKIDYNAIVYENKIVIKPNVSMSSLESKTIGIQIVKLEQVGGKMVPVEGVLNNRPLDLFSTPAPTRSENKWEFYVDQSPIKWSEDQITITTTDTKAFDPKIVRLKNDGGTFVDYTLTNFPIWMEIYPKAGILAPGASVDITINIRTDEIGIGEKNNIIEVNTAYGIEKLKVKVRKVATPPNWVVNPNQFEKSMTMIAEVNLPIQGNIEPGSAMSFNGLLDVVTVPNNSSFNLTGDFTIEGWFSIDTRSNRNNLKTDNWHALVSKGFKSTNDYTFAIETNPSTTRLGFWIHGVKTIYSNTFNLDLNKFYHFAISRSSGEITFYVNGDPIGSQTGFIENVTNSNSLYIGNGLIFDLPAATSGVIDEVRFWNVGKNSIDLHEKMYDELIGNEQNLIACFQFNEKTGNTVNDNSTNHFSGTSARSDAWTTTAPPIGKSRLYNISNDELDLVAVFVGNEIRGVGSIRYIPDFKKYLSFLTIYSNSNSSEDLRFNIWEASKGLNWNRINENYKFISDTNIGSVYTPAKITIDLSIEKTLKFKKGWNWISLNATTSDMSLNSMLPYGNFSNGDLIKSQSQFSQLQFDSTTTIGSWTGTLASLNATSMFMSKVNNDAIRIFNGTPVVPSLTPIQLSKGWNWIGFTPQSPLDIQLAFTSVRLRTGDLIKSQTAFSSYTSGIGWIGNLNSLEPFKGYQLKLQDENPGTLIYPTPSNNINTVASNLTDSLPSDWKLNPSNFQYSMTMVGTIISSGIDTLFKDDYFGAFAGDEFRGFGNIIFVPSINKYRIFNMMYSNSIFNDTLNFKYYNSITKQLISLKEKILFVQNDNLGSVTNPIKFNLSLALSVDDELIPKKFALHQNYPNPFNPTTTIKYDLPNDENVKIIIYSILGQKIKTLVNTNEKAGYKKVMWNGTDDSGNKVASGIYFYKISAGNFTSNRKMILMK